MSGDGDDLRRERQEHLEELVRQAEAGDVGLALRVRRERLHDKVAAGLALFSRADHNGKLPSPDGGKGGAARKTTP